MEAQQCDECDDGWRRCRRRKSNPAVAAVGVDRESSPDITIIEALLSSSSSSSMGRIHDNTASMSAVSSSTCSQRPALFAAVGTATSATFPVNSSAKQQQNQQQTQRQQQQHHTKQSSPEILGERYQRHKNHTRNLNHRCALWILSLICGGRWYFCSAFQQQQLRQHYTLANSNVLELSHPTTDEDHTVTTTATRSLKINLTKLFFSPTNQREQQQQYPPTFNQPQRSDTSTTTTINNNSSKKRNPTNISIDNDDTADPRQQQPQRRKQYRRKLPLSPSEKSAALNRQKRRVAYETMRSKSLATTNAPPSIWSFDSFFAAPVLDEKSIREDLFGTKEREAEMMRERAMRKRMLLERRKERECLLRDAGDVGSSAASATDKTIGLGVGSGALESASVEAIAASTMITGNELDIINKVENDVIVADPSSIPSSQDGDEPRPPVDKVLTRMVQDRINGLTRSPAGSIQYSSSLLDSGRAVQFRDGIRLGKALTINIDRLCYFAKKDFSHGRLEEAQEYYMKARNMDPTDGRPYLGLSRIAQRRGDYEAARSLLKEGIAKSSGGFVVVKGPGGGAGGGGGSTEKEAKNGRRGNNRDNNGDLELDGEVESTIGTIPDIGPNPFLLQALGTLEQQLGQLAAAEELYLQALRSRPSHAAAWVSLAQLRTKELRQGASAGRACYQSAERELQRIGAKPNSFVYTAWASMEYKKGSREDDAKCVQKARELYQKALNVDPQCSAAYLQLGVMESECGNFDEAKMCFEKVLKFDQRNSRVLQAYAVMESRRAPKDEVDSRRVLDLFERALKANPRDAGVYQAYALYVSELGDIDSARKL
jgi:tetratricopeptide (TPR) repeat protein